MQGQFVFSPVQPLHERKDTGNRASEFSLKKKSEKGQKCREMRDPSPQIQRSPLKKEHLPTKVYSKRMW